jgi:hypothetical protein
MRLLAGLAVLVGLGSVARAEAPAVVPHTAVWPIKVKPNTVPNLVNSHIVFLNRCTNGCPVKPASEGTTDSTVDQSDIAGGNVMLSAYNGGDAKWSAIVNCVKGVMAPFNIQVTDQDPGMQPHFEVMVAGLASQLNSQLGSQGILGIADYACTDPSNPGSCYAAYLPNALVFAFANDQYFGGDTNEICGTAAQEIAHAWTLDHTTVTSDPMTYYNYATPLKFKNGAQCGSDCQGSQSPFGLPCTNNTHVCMSTGQQTQDELDIITKIFGPTGAAAPTVKIKNPANGSAVHSGFTLEVDCTASDPIQEIDWSVDGIQQVPMTTAPYMASTPTLTKGTHHITALCGTTKQATATATSDFIVGDSCSADADCNAAGFICYEQTCIAGPTAMGGLGAACTNNSDCDSTSCASDGKDSFCVIPCDLSNPKCPSGFGCLAANAGGVCWAGIDNGGGGCCDSGGRGSSTGPILLGLGFAATLVTRRKRK